MSGSSSQSKTEQPTEKKLRDLRKQGNVSMSRDAVSTAGIFVAMILFSMAGPHLLSQMEFLMVRAASFDFNSLENDGTLLRATQEFFLQGFLMTLPFMVVLICVSALATYMQVGGLFAIEKVKPDLKKLNPIEGIKKLFALRNWIELLKLIFKAICLMIVVYVLVRQMLPLLFNARFMPVAGVLLLANKVLSALVWIALAVFIPIAAFDLWFQQNDYIRQNRMTKDEVKREYKDTEGDPHIKGRRNQLKHELSMQGMLDNVRKSNVVIVNPTHIAVALYYNPGETDLPVVMGKGEGFIAEAIREVAEREGIPILRDVQLARRLQAQVPVNQYIPDDLIEPVAAVLRWVRDIKEQNND